MSIDQTPGPPSPPEPPSQVLTVRRHRDPAALLSRIQPGDLAVIERADLDAATARRLIDARPGAVLNLAPFITGRYANLGPRVLAEAGIPMLQADAAASAVLRDGKQVRLRGSTLYDGAVVLCDLEVLQRPAIEAAMETAQAGMAAQLDSFAHTTSEFLRREEGVLLHGSGLPVLRAGIDGRPVLVVDAQATRADLKSVRRFVREQKPVLIAVDGAAELFGRRLRPDVLILDGDASISDKALSACREVVLNHGTEPIRKRLEKRNLLIHEVATSVASGDLGLLLAHLEGARLLIPLGFPADLEEFVDIERSDQASNVLTRLRVGARLVEADAVPLLYTGRVRRTHLAATWVAALAVLGVTVAATPIGNGWADDVRHRISSTWGQR